MPNQLYNQENRTFRQLDFNGILGQRIVNILNLIPRARMELVSDPDSASVLWSAVVSLWYLVKRYMPVEYQLKHEKDIKEVEELAIRSLANPTAAKDIFSAANKLFDDCIGILEEKGKLEKIRLDVNI